MSEFVIFGHNMSRHGIAKTYNRLTKFDFSKKELTLHSTTFFHENDETGNLTWKAAH